MESTFSLKSGVFMDGTRLLPNLNTAARSAKVGFAPCAELRFASDKPTPSSKQRNVRACFEDRDRPKLGLGIAYLLHIRAIQARNDIEISDPKGALESWPILGSAGEFQCHCLHFSVEMETGTGKTYVYLRTIFELPRRDGFKKFIIVVPSVTKPGSGTSSSSSF